MPSPHTKFHSEFECLEDRVVPAGITALDPDFFEKLQFQAYDQANQAQARAIREITGIYKDAQQQVQTAESQIDSQENQVMADTQSQAAALQKLFQDDLQKLKDFANAVQNRNKEDVNDLQNQTQNALNALAKTPGLDQAAVAQQTGVILAWSRAQYENLTKGVENQMQEVLLAYQTLQQQQKDQFAGVVNAAIAKYKELEAVKAQLLQAYDTNNAALVDQYQQVLNQIQQALIQQLNAIQDAWINYSQIVSQQQLYQSYDYPGSFTYGGTGYSGSSGGGDRITYDEGAPKGGH
jgi:hypothetical protein